MHYLRGTVALCLSALTPLSATATPFDCVIQPRSIASIIASDKGTITAIAVKRGQLVHVGDVLVQLDDEVQRLQVELAQKQLASDVDIRAAEERLATRQRIYDRALALSKRNSATVTAVEDAESELVRAALSLEQAKTSRELATIQMRQAEALLRRRTVVSQVDGLVTDVTATPGEYSHEQFTLMTIAQIDPLHVQVYLPPEKFQQVQAGQSYLVTQARPLQGSYQARVSVVDQIFDAASGTFGVVLEIPNPDGKIPAGTRCLIEIKTTP